MSFDTPSVISLAAHLVTSQNPDWSLSAMEELHARYFRERHHVNTLKLGRILEAAFTLTLAEQNRAAGNLIRARELIAFSIEDCPKHVGLRNFEASMHMDDLVAIDWQTILLPTETPR